MEPSTAAKFLIGLAVMTAVWVAISGASNKGAQQPTLSPPSPPAASPAAPAERPHPSEKAKALQPKRKAALDRLVSEGVFTGYLRPEEKYIFVVFRIGPAWRNLSLERKRIAADVAFTYHWVEMPHLTSALLEDWRTGKTVASFSPEFGLRIEE